MPDAVVIGAGQNGLVAANLLADRGWEVLVLEEAAEPGGAVRSGELVERGFTNDLFSAFYPFSVVSPHIRRLELERWGLRWLASPIAVAHPARDGSCPCSAISVRMGSCASPASRCCRSAASARSASAARAARGCWPATRFTPTLAPRCRPAAWLDGCS